VRDEEAGGFEDLCENLKNAGTFVSLLRVCVRTSAVNFVPPFQGLRCFELLSQRFRAALCLCRP